jgi:hypothetical protein
MDYMIITGDNLTALADKVRKALGEGWRPQGGVFVQPYTEVGEGVPPKVQSGNTLLQAVVRD